MSVRLFNIQCVLLTAIFCFRIAAASSDQIFLELKSVSSITNQNGNPQGTFTDIQVLKKHAFLSWIGEKNDSGGLLILDVSNPAAPICIGAYSGQIGAHSVRVDGSYAYLVGRDGTNETGLLEVINVYDPSKPFRLSRTTTTGLPLCVRVTNRLAFISLSLRASETTTVSGALEIFDIQDRLNPVRISAFNTAAPTAAFEVMGNFAYIADGISDLAVIDISDPTTPKQIGAYDTDEWNNYGGFEHGGVAVQTHRDGNLIYSAGEDGLHILDVTAPSAPVRVGGINVFPYDYTFHVSGGIVFTLIWSSYRDDFLMIVYDVKIPSKPVTLTWTEAALPRAAFQFTEPYVYLVGSSLQIYEIRHEPAFRFMELSRGQIFLKWNAPPGMILQTAASLENPVWIDIPRGDSTEFQFPITETNNFFRLYKP